MTSGKTDELKGRVKLYRGQAPIFDHFGIEVLAGLKMLHEGIEVLAQEGDEVGAELGPGPSNTAVVLGAPGDEASGAVGVIRPDAFR